MRPKWLNRAMLLAPYYTLCLSVQDARDVFKHLGIRRRNRPEFVRSGVGATTHIIEAPGKLCAVVCVRLDAQAKHTEMYALLAHEAVHIWQALLRDIGEDSPGDEIEAYSIQHITQHLIEEYQRQTGGSK